VAVYRRWGDSEWLYGTTDRLYGLAGATSTNTLWEISVDWDGDGLFTDEDNFAEFCTDLQIRRGRRDYINIAASGSANGFENMKVGTATIIADNSDGRFDPFNTSSPYSPNVLPGRFIRIRAKDGDTGTNYDVFNGKVKDIQPVSSKRNSHVRISCEDGGRMLASLDTSIAITQSITKDTAVGLILDDIAWPTVWGRTIETSGDTLPFFWGKNRAITEINDIADAELGIFFVAASGKATFYSRNHIASPSVTLTQSDVHS